jgi:hypothetical protein
VWFAYQSTTVTDFVQTVSEAIGQSADIFKADLLTLKVKINFQLFYAYFGNFPRKQYLLILLLSSFEPFYGNFFVEILMMFDQYARVVVAFFVFWIFSVTLICQVLHSFRV